MSNGAAVVAILEGELSRQAAAITYVNDFKLMMWIVLASAPLVLLLRNPTQQVAAAAGWLKTPVGRDQLLTDRRSLK